MEHLVIYFHHSIRDIIPYSEFISNTRLRLELNGLGEYLGDDVAIDGGDAEGVFSCPNAKILFDFLEKDLFALPFMKDAKITFIFGEIDSDSPRKEFYIN
jgi:hypothetical protein